VRPTPHVLVMSRAFVNEDAFVADLPDRPISEHPNLVTPRGLEQIDSALETARREYGEAQASGDRDALARAGRDLRYWSARRASADLVPIVPDINGVVHFGGKVTIVRDDGRTQTFQIVGEDEADPLKGSISHAAPLARALIGKRIGDVVRAGKDDAEITAID
jgi:transcription elongation GreA/GreB family factor